MLVHSWESRIQLFHGAEAQTTKIIPLRIWTVSGSCSIMNNRLQIRLLIHGRYRIPKLFAFDIFKGNRLHILYIQQYNDLKVTKMSRHIVLESSNRFWSDWEKIYSKLFFKKPIQFEELFFLEPRVRASSGCSNLSELKFEINILCPMRQ